MNQGWNRHYPAVEDQNSAIAAVAEAFSAGTAAGLSFEPHEATAAIARRLQQNGVLEFLLQDLIPQVRRDAEAHWAERR